jgi:hypothetical protein
MNWDDFDPMIVDHAMLMSIGLEPFEGNVRPLGVVGKR